MKKHSDTIKTSIGILCFGYLVYHLIKWLTGHQIFWIYWVSIGVALTYMIVGTIYTYKTLNKAKTEPETAN